MTIDDRGRRRAETAREHDDSDVIEEASAEGANGQQGSSGGGMQRDIGTQAAKQKVRDPQAHESRTKEDEMAQGDFSPGRRSATEVVEER